MWVVRAALTQEKSASIGVCGSKRRSTADKLVPLEFPEITPRTLVLAFVLISETNSNSKGDAMKSWYWSTES